jgi:xanthine dehydrogenase/oxidase
MAVTTIEGIGNAQSGYHPIQQRLADASGTQCGFCSPGMVMAMYSLLTEDPNPTQLRIEQELDGNLCRCTGYRPILDAFKSFGVNDEAGDCRKHGCQRQGLFRDIEEMIPIHHKHHAEHKPQVPRPHMLKDGKKPQPLLHRAANGIVWQDLHTEQDIVYWLPYYTKAGSKVILVVGRLSLGVYPQTTYDVVLNIETVQSLGTLSTDPTNGITIGATCTINDIQDYLSKAAPSPAYKGKNLQQAAAHLRRVAGRLVRNAGSIAGNFMMVKNNAFASDALIVFLGLGATITVIDCTTSAASTIDLISFLAPTFSMVNKYIQKLNVPWASANDNFQSYKIALRQVNSHAIVNASMRAVVDPTTGRVLSQPTIAYGGVALVQQRMTAVEQAMVGMLVTDQIAFQALCTQLSSLLVPDPSLPRAAYRKSVALNYFYKFFLSLQPTLPPTLTSATQPWLTRPLTVASQAFQPNPAEFPVSQGTPKMDAVLLTSGSALFTGDNSVPPTCQFATLVLAPVGPCTIDPTKIDTTAARALPGYIGFYCATDIPPAANGGAVPQCEVFCSGSVLYAGQVVGVVLADTQDHAKACAAVVVVPYTNLQTPLVTIKDALAAKSFFPQNTWPVFPPVGNVTTGFANSKHVLSDTVHLGGQQPFHMENHVTVATPSEGGLRLVSATQAPVMVQGSVSTITGLPFSAITVESKRCGGGFGGKIMNALIPSAIASFCATKVNKPVSLTVEMSDAMRALGHREEYLVNYKIGFNDNGAIIALQAEINTNCGCSPADGIGSATVLLNSLDNCYNIPNWSLTAPLVMSNIPCTGPVRGPGWVPAIVISERLIARVASTLGMTMDAVRSANFYTRGAVTPSGQPLTYWNMDVIYPQIQQSSDYVNRQAAVQAFNAANKWLKRGIAIMPSKFGISYGGAFFSSLVCLYPDGTVGVTHGGCEIGQGINTKVAQCTAFALGIPTSSVTIYNNSSSVLPEQSNVTGGSITSELCGLSVLDACQTLNQRLAPFRKAGVTFQAAVAAASQAGVSLSAKGYTKTPAVPTMFNYNSYSAAVSEVEVDVLTGQIEIIRSDILFDCGISMNPTIDIGQVEGGFMYGLGYLLTETILRDPKTGANTTATTWDYKPASAYDLPETFNVTLLRDAPNPKGVLGAKACGEPPVALAASVLQAIEEAVTTARNALGVDTKRWVCTETPLTVEGIQLACGINSSMFNLK